MLNGNGFATSRSPISLGGDVFSSSIVRTSFSYYAVSRLQRVSSLPKVEPVGAMYAWLQAERTRSGSHVLRHVASLWRES
jgi:hypothetical protein